MKRVVITGMGALTPLGNDLETTWKNLKKGLSGINHISKFDASCLSSKIAGELKGFSPENYMPKKDILRLDPFVHYAIAAAIMAAEDAGLIQQSTEHRIQNTEYRIQNTDKKLKIQNSKLKTPFVTRHSSLEKAGVIIGSSRGGISTIERELLKLKIQNSKLSSYLMPSTTIGMASSYISMRLAIKGPTIGISTACASGANAIGEAFKLIRYGEAQVALAGGSEAPVCRLSVGGYGASGALSRRNSEPEKASRPFDKDRDGFAISEGAGVVVLEELNHALRRNARIYAEISGYGTSSDAFHQTKPLSDGEALAIKKALSDAKASKDDVDYINAHATGTVLGDKAEAETIKKVFGKRAPRIPISASKSMLGHMLGAAGAVEAIITALSINKGVITPTINLDCPDIVFNPACFRKPTKADINTAISNSFGFGGVNAVLVIKKFRS